MPPRRSSSSSGRSAPAKGRASTPVAAARHTNGFKDGHSTSAAVSALKGDRLVTIEEVPTWLRFNRFILTGYRPPMNVTRALKSFFEFHNESINVWGHFAAAVVLLYLVVVPPVTQYFSYGRAGSEGSSVVLGEEFRYGTTGNFFRFVAVGSMTFIFSASSAYHLLMPACSCANSYSRLLCVDVFGALLSITVSAFSFTLHGDPCRSEAENYLYSGVLLVTFAIVVYSIFLSSLTVGQRFGVFGLHCALRGVLCHLTLYPRLQSEGQYLAYYYHMYGLVILTLGGLLNTLRVPERFLGGWRHRWVDYALNSHNLWHYCCLHSCIVTILACYYQELEWGVSPCFKPTSV